MNRENKFKMGSFPDIMNCKKLEEKVKTVGPAGDIGLIRDGTKEIHFPFAYNSFMKESQGDLHIIHLQTTSIQYRQVSIFLSCSCLVH